MWWTALINPVGEAIKTWQKNRSEAGQARHEANMARIKDHSTSWKDEIVLLVWSYPVVSAFIPPLQENTSQAFLYMQDLPEWYLGGFIAISLAVYGVNKVARFKR